MINVNALNGRLTKDVDLRYTSTGKAVASFTLAVERSFTNEQGERGTDFIPCVIWGKRAESMSNFTCKGSLIGISGRIQSRNYENQEGQKVYVVEVVADDYQLLESRAVTEGRMNPEPQQSNP